MIKVFLSYSHEDEALRAELNEHIGALRHEEIIETWSDHQVPVGSNWNEEILGQLEAADLILLLVSSSFLNSRYCYVDEMKRAIERHDKREAIVVPILLRHCYWQPAPFARIQGLPRGMIPVADDNASRAKRDLVWSRVAQGIHEAVIACNNLGNSGETMGQGRAASQATSITITGMRTVDEGQLDRIIREFKPGDKVGIRWPNSSHQLISLMREAIQKFDEANVNFDGADAFIQRVPEALARAVRNRERFEQRLPELMNIMSDYGFKFKSRLFAGDNSHQCRVSAIKYFLLWANFIGHREIGHLSSWAGLRHLGLKVPEAWIPFQTIPDREWLSKLHPGTKFTHVYLSQMAGHFFMPFTKRSIYTPDTAVKEGEFKPDALTICTWAIPQIEMIDNWAFPDAPPKSYKGAWEGNVNEFFTRISTPWGLR